MAIILWIAALSIVIVYGVKMLLSRREKNCYMLNYECYMPRDESKRKVTTESSCRIALRNTKLGLEEYRFLLQTMIRGGIGERTYSPENVIHGNTNPSLLEAIDEMDDIFFQTIDRLFENSSLLPHDIDILVVNVSLLASEPSLSERVINRYKLRPDVKVYNLSGMGCSASLVAVDLVHRLFKIHRRQVAMVVSTESLGPNWYSGCDKSFMLSNCLFRSGGCSMLLTNDPRRHHRAIMKLTESVRTHFGSNDEAYECCYQDEDEEGYRGFRLTRKLTKAAAKALVMNLKVLVPKILPKQELLRWFVVDYLPARRRNSKIKGPNFKAGIDHFCIHPGGRAVIDEVGKSLGLDDYDLEPPRMALHRWGNTSAGGLWYVLGYMEAKNRLKKGDKILMISLGAGFKCNNCTWEVVSHNMNTPNIWEDCIDDYPLASAEKSPFADKFDWIYDEHMGFIRMDHSSIVFSNEI